MIRLISAALRHPTHRTLGELPALLVAQPCAVVRPATDGAAVRPRPHPRRGLRRRAGALRSTVPRCYWFDDLDSLARHATHPESVALWTTVMADDAQLFDRDQTWPTDHRRATVVGTEQVVHGRSDRARHDQGDLHLVASARPHHRRVLDAPRVGAWRVRSHGCPGFVGTCRRTHCRVLRADRHPRPDPRRLFELWFDRLPRVEGSRRLAGVVGGRRFRREVVRPPVGLPDRATIRS